MYTIADIANSKHHQRLDEIWIFFYPHSWKIRKVVYKKILAGRMLYETRARNYNKDMLTAQDFVKFRGRISWQMFL